MLKAGAGGTGRLWSEVGFARDLPCDCHKLSKSVVLRSPCARWGQQDSSWQAYFTSVFLMAVAFFLRGDG